MQNTSLSLEERLRADHDGQIAEQIVRQLTAIDFRLESEKRKLHTRTSFEHIVAAETAVKSALVALQLFNAAKEK
jgi:hypothetical protein